ncbi:unnamed protein product [Calicophoron daubneyi]|uniref:Kynureninase n=1 Tax=Calicophoron daubneyi TaxID=300641 RepID=A0AAV2SXA3_CALDB
MSVESFMELASKNAVHVDSQEFAEVLDKQDPLGCFKSEFIYPTCESLEKWTTIRFSSASKSIPTKITYLCGNSLGLQPRNLEREITKVLQQWGGLGVYAYNSGPLPASYCDLQLSHDVAKLIVGAEEDEVAVTCNLSVNMHMLLAAFYRPDGNRSCVLVEERAFPTDYYAIESHIVWHGLNPLENVIQISPRSGEHCLHKEDIIKAIRANASRLALVWLPGVQYTTGQVFDIEEITRAAHEIAHCPIGWDLAHSVGNVPLELHKWEVDIAVWCSYKYLNGSPGALGGIFVNRKHHNVCGVHGPSQTPPGVIPNGPMLTGWWSHRTETRFDMSNNMELAPGALAYRISNPPLLLAAALRASLDIFQKCGGLQALRKKSILLTGYLYYLLRYSSFALPEHNFKIVTPEDPSERAAQLTIEIKNRLDYYFDQMTTRGFICDVRKPNFIRVTPVPLYNTYVDVYEFAKTLSDVVKSSE